MADNNRLNAIPLAGGVGFRLPARSRLQLDDHVAITAIPVDKNRKSVIRALFKDVKTADLDPDHCTCQVCREDFRDNDPDKQTLEFNESLDDQEVPVSLPCTHIFGNLCALEWLARHGNCPHPWCGSSYLLHKDFIASVIAKASTGNDQRSARQKAAQAEKYKDFTKKYWQRERAEYISKLRAKGGLPVEALTTLEWHFKPRDPTSDKALRFIEKNTLREIPPNPAARFICYHIAERPELLHEQRFQAARYFEWKEQRRSFLNFEELARLLQIDLGN